jgi:phage host-nuclease inhibitor protein Gam
MIDTPESTERFAIRDAATAAWAIGTINAAKAELAYRTQAARDWIAEAERNVTALESRFLDELRAWGEANLPAKKKTIVFRTGRMEFRTKAARFAVVDEVKALDWSKQHLPAAVVVKETISAEALIAHAKASGELPDGVERVPEVINGSFSIK